MPKAWVELAPAAAAGPGHALQVAVVVHDAPDLAGWEAELRFDGKAAEYSGTRSEAGAERRRFVPFAAVEHGDGVTIGGWACPTGGCGASLTTSGTSSAVVVATVELDPLVAGRLSLALSSVRLADSSGRALVTRSPKAVTVRVGESSAKHRAPKSADPWHGHRTQGVPTDAPKLDLDGNGRIDRSDVLAVVPEWADRHEQDDICGGPRSAADVNGDGCVDVADVAAVAARIGTTPSGDIALQHIAGSSTTFVVNSTSDAGDATPDGICQTSIPGECTLRAAMTEANRLSGQVTINFNIPGTGVHTLNPATQLPTLHNANATVTIDGFTQPGSSVNTDPLASNAVYTIEISGQGPNGIDGIYMVTASNIVRGLDLHGFKRDVRMYGQGAHDNEVIGNLIGLFPDGTLDPRSTLVPGASCVHTQGGAFQNHVGMAGAANRNVISGCSHQGVTFYDYLTDSNFVQNNIIGLDPTGTVARPNQNHGVDVNTFTTNTMIGGNAPGEHNVVSGNNLEGVEISHGTGTLYNKVIGNYVGTDVTGNNAPAYAANGDRGIRLEGAKGCNNLPCGLDEGFETVTDNVVVHSGLGGILVDKGTHDSLIARNRFGVTLNGTPAGNTLYGIQIEAGAQHNTVGPGNIVAYNENGILITSLGTQPANSSSSPTLYNTVTQNSIHDNLGYGLGIDLAPFGQVNTAANADPNANGGLLAPNLVSTTAASAVVTTCPGCTVEAFLSNAGASSFGPGVQYFSTVVADTNGDATLYLGPSAQNGYVTTTTTDTNGNTSEFSNNRFVPLPRANNVPPTASAAVSCTHLTCTFDSAGSHDPDRTIVRYHWDFGDGTSADGAVLNHTYASAGTYSAVLTVTDSDAATATAPVTATAVNANPTASFTFSCAFQKCNFDGTASSDPDGTVASWLWNFGDGTTGTGSTTSHTYAAGGTFNVTLTVNDGENGTGTQTKPVTVTSLPAGTVGNDAFARTVSGGLGTADVGGPWSTSANSVFSVGNGVGQIAMATASTSRYAWLPSVNERDADVQVSVGSSVAPQGSWGQTLAATARHVAANTEYRARVRFAPDLSVRLSLASVNGTTTENQIGTEVTVPGLTWSSSAMFSVHLRVTGVNPTTLQARVWPAGAAEPTTWNVTGTDSTASLQTSGSAGFQGYLGTLPSGGVTFRFDDFNVRFINSPPTASFTSACSNKTCNLDANASVDPDGTIASYAWDFGDGTSGTGVTPSHVYAQFGTYTIALTVTDNRGATGSVSHQVTVGNVAPSAAFTVTCFDPQTCSVDATSSVDPDGSIVSYAWDFGDGTQATGPTATHAYSVADVYTIVLQVTDNDGGVGTATQTVTVLPPNAPPVASFSFSCSSTTCQFNGTGSSDSDGSVSLWAWDFGDGGNATGATTSHTYAATTPHVVTLQVTDDRGSTTTWSRSVSFTSSCAALACSFSAPTASSYGWTFGDGGTSTSAAPSHTYSVAGTYPVTLSVTDAHGTVGTSTLSATAVPANGTTLFASDTFTRTQSGWGTADTGGAWTLSTAAPFSTNGSAGRMVISSASSSATALLNSVSNIASDVSVKVSADKAATGNFGQYVGVLARRVAQNKDYRGRIRFKGTQVFAAAEMLNGTATEVVIGTEDLVPSLTYTPGATYGIRVNVSGTSPTTIKVKVWNLANAEPAAWTLTRTDSSALLQAAGGVGVMGFVSAASTSVPVTFTFDDFLVRPANQPPVGAFTSSCTDLACGFDASTSTDSDGTIVSYTWNFGDGTTGTGVTPTHTYAAGGTYNVTLTTTDDGGASTYTTHPVTVNAPPVAQASKTCSYLICSFDGSGSYDPDGTIASYAWDFGDGATASTAQPSHTYSTAGTYNVSLTVVDNSGRSVSTSLSVTVTANVAPTASFTFTCTNRACSFDAHASSDDVSIVSYAWDFGDGTTGSGVTASHTYTNAGNYTVTLTVTDNVGATGSTSASLLADTPPTALLQTSCTGAACSFDATASTDTDGTIASYAWTFGDGTTGTGVTTTHTYGVAGTYTVGLVVTDNLGRTGSASTQLSATPPNPTSQYALDTFSRVQSPGWGTADQGGAWSPSTASVFSVNGSTGQAVIGAGTSFANQFPGVSSNAIDVTVKVATDKTGTGNSGHYVGVVGRRVSTSLAYRGRVRFKGTQVIAGVVMLNNSTSETLIGSEVVVPGLTATPGVQYSIRVQVFGTNPTTINLKVWQTNTAEPAAWTVSRTDSTAGLQTAGIVGLTGFVSANSTTAPVTFSFDDFTVRPSNLPPSPAFTSTCTDLACSFDASSSTDDGTIASYTWNFGDGSTATGVTPSHTFATAGTYTVTLTVTDNGGVSSYVSHPLTVAIDQPPTAAFTSSCTNLGCSFDGSTSSDADGTVASYAWAFGDGATGTGSTPSHTYAAAGNYTVTLTVTDNLGKTGQVSHGVSPTAANQSPVAAFTSSCTNLDCSFDGSTSSDADGTVASYAWDFGDGTSGTGSTPTHTYGLAGTYTVVLTVTDDKGATNQVSHAVTVS